MRLTSTSMLRKQDYRHLVRSTRIWTVILVVCVQGSNQYITKRITRIMHSLSNHTDPLPISTNNRTRIYRITPSLLLFL